MEEEYQNIHGCWSSYYTTICIEARNNDFTAVEALKTENKAYNRYRDVYPYDHSRVQLQRYFLFCFLASFMGLLMKDLISMSLSI